MKLVLVVVIVGTRIMKTEEGIARRSEREAGVLVTVVAETVTGTVVIIRRKKINLIKRKKTRSISITNLRVSVNPRSCTRIKRRVIKSARTNTMTWTEIKADTRIVIEKCWVAEAEMEAAVKEIEIERVVEIAVVRGAE